MLKFHIKTYGCQMNERDSEAIAASLVKSGFISVENEAEADILLFNTCSVREQAERKAIGKIGLMKKLKKDKPEIIIGLLGCMAERIGSELIEHMPHIDFVVGTGNLHKIPELIHCAIRNKKVKKVELGHDKQNVKELFAELAGHIHSNTQVSAFIAIMRGCDRFCSYCIVPYVRGREASRPIDDIVSEAKTLAENGIKEIVLLGQNVAGYGFKEKWGNLKSNESPFADLLERLNNIEGIYRIRFTSPHPCHFNDRLIEAVISLKKVCKNIHLPVQSGSERILKLMNRHYTPEEYMSIIEKLKSGAPEITFSTDVIVGFPTETDEDFAKTRQLMQDVGFDNAYIFKYSPRKGTKAAEYKDDVPQQIKEERNQILLADLAKRAAKHNSILVGKEFEILVEGESKRNSSRWCGRTDTNKLVVFENNKNIRPGKIITVKITETTASTLYGYII